MKPKHRTFNTILDKYYYEKRTKLPEYHIRIQIHWNVRIPIEDLVALKILALITNEI